MLRLCGAELREVPAVPFRDPNNYVQVAERLAAELAASEPNGVLYANQWDNLANRDGHFRTTGPEIWRQTDGRVDGFICAIGTGGTLAGVGAFLKASSARTSSSPPRTRWAPPCTTGSSTASSRSEGSSITEGIGQGRITGNIDGRAGRRRVPDPRRRGAARPLRPARVRRGSAWAARAASTWPARSAWRGTWGRDTRS